MREMPVINNMNQNTGGGGVLFPIEETVEESNPRQVNQGRRLFLVGGPWGPLYPMGMPFSEGYEEDEDPNP